MSIIDNINEQLVFDKNKIYPGGEELIEKIVERAPMQLPADYYELLGCISGEGNSGAIIFAAKEGLIAIWSAEKAFGMQDEFSYLLEDCNNKVWFIGNDVGDLIYFYGQGKDGFGIYCGEDCDLESANKIADTLTDFLINGIGIDIATTL